GYWEPFTNSDILDKYQNLVHDAVDLMNSGLQPMFSKRLIDLQHVYKNAVEEHLKNNMKKQTLYKYFDAYDNLVNPKAKPVTFQKEAANYDEDFPNAQLYYAIIVMNGKDVKRKLKRQ
ncbi:12221_t:CDS:2, partial [Funneliformis caledonium]